MHRITCRCRIIFNIPVDRCFPVFISRINEDGANVKIDSRFEAGSRRYRLAGKRYCRIYKRQQTLDREERVALRDTKFEFRMGELQAEDKKSAEDLQAERKREQIKVTSRSRFLRLRLRKNKPR